MNYSFKIKNKLQAFVNRETCKGFLVNSNSYTISFLEFSSKQKAVNREGSAKTQKGERFIALLFLMFAKLEHDY